MAQRFEGRNLDEALERASVALNAERYLLSYRVVLERRGFLGGMKRVVIDVEKREPGEVERPVDPPEPELSLPPLSRPERGARRGGGRERGGRERGGRDRGGRYGGNRDDHGSRERQGRRPRGVQVEAALLEAPPVGEETTAATAVREWCESLFRHGHLDLQARPSQVDEATIRVSLYGSDLEQALDHHGELIDAIQVIANKALTGRSVNSRIDFDAGSFKEEREERLREMALSAADRVRRDGGEQLLPAMSPIERRIVHLALQDADGVTTESQGEGFYKRVAVRSASNPQ